MKQAKKERKLNIIKVKKRKQKNFNFIHEQIGETSCKQSN